MRDAPWRKVFQRALVPVTVGFVVSGGYVLATPVGPRLAQRADRRRPRAAILYRSKLNPLWILAGGGVLGYFLF